MGLEPDDMIGYELLERLIIENGPFPVVAKHWKMVKCFKVDSDKWHTIRKLRALEDKDKYEFSIIIG